MPLLQEPSISCINWDFRQPGSPCILQPPQAGTPGASRARSCIPWVFLFLGHAGLGPWNPFNTCLDLFTFRGVSWEPHSRGFPRCKYCIAVPQLRTYLWKWRNPGFPTCRSEFKEFPVRSFPMCIYHTAVPTLKVHLCTWGTLVLLVLLVAYFIYLHMVSISLG